MKIREAIERLDEVFPNTFDDVQKVRWLGRLDHSIVTELWNNYETLCGADFTPYSEETDLDTEILVQEPYCELYSLYLQAQIHMATGETGLYATAAQAFNIAYQRYADFINRTYRRRKPAARWYR